MLSVEEIKLIESEVQNAHISYSHLEYDLIDHICCDVENKIQEGISFNEAFNTVKKSIGKGGLKQIQKDTLLLIDKNYRIMKKSMKTLGVVALAMMALAALFKIQHWPGASIMLILSFFIINFFFFPTAMYVMYKEMYNKKRAVFFIIGTVAGISFMFGILFKIQHWPGASILILTGAVLFIIFLLQSIIFPGKEEFKSKSIPVVNILTVISIIIYVLGFLFKIQHWPGAAILITSSTILLTSILLPWYTVIYFKNSEGVKLEFIFLMCALIYFLLFGLLLSIKVSKKNITDEFIITGNYFTTTTSLLEGKNNNFYFEVESTNKAHELLQKIKLQVDEIDSIIESIKIQAIIIVEETSESNAIKLLKDPIKIERKGAHLSKTIKNDKIQEQIMLLKSEIEVYKNILLNNLNQPNSVVATSIQNLLKTEPNKSYGNKTWEETQFQNTFLLAALKNFSALQCKIRLAEKEAINAIYNSLQITKEKN